MRWHAPAFAVRIAAAALSAALSAAASLFVAVLSVAVPYIAAAEQTLAEQQYDEFLSGTRSYPTVSLSPAGYNIIGQQVLSLASSVHASAEASNWVYYRVDAALLKYKWRGQIADAKKVGSNGIAIIDPNTGAVSYSESAYGNDGIKIVYLKDTDGTKGETTAGAMLKDPRTRVSIVRPNGRAVSVYGKFAHVVPIYTGPATAYGWKPSRSFVSTDYPACSFYGITVGIYNDSQQSIANAQLDRELWMKVTFKTEKAAYPRKQQVMFPIGSQYVHDFTIAGPATEPAVDEGATAIPTNPTPGEINIVQQAQ